MRNKKAKMLRRAVRAHTRGMLLGAEMAAYLLLEKIQREPSWGKSEIESHLKELIKEPAEGGLDEVRRKLKEMRKKEPSPELVKTIEEVTNCEPGGQD